MGGELHGIREFNSTTGGARPRVGDVAPDHLRKFVEVREPMNLVRQSGDTAYAVVAALRNDCFHVSLFIIAFQEQKGHALVE